MTYFLKLKTSLANSLCNLGIDTGEQVPEMSLSSAPFDSLRIDDPGQSPDFLPALFGSRERSLGDPAHLFPGQARMKSKMANPEQAKFQWLDVLDGLKPYGLRGQIAGINTYLNRSADAPALAYLGQKSARNSQWTTPLRMFHNAGSEHVAFAKYLSLLKIGVSAERLRLVWIEDGSERTNRVVLAATFGGHNFILDSRHPDIFEDADLTHFRPYCSTTRSRFSLHWAGRDTKGWETSLKQLGLHARH